MLPGPRSVQREVAIVSSAVVTGPFERVADMALRLKVAGFEVLAAEPDVGQIPPGVDEVDCYVQLPNDALPAGDHAPKAHGHALTARFRATVVLVADPPDVTPAPDMRLVRLLMEAIIADHGGDDVRIAVIDAARPDADIIAIAQSASRSA